MRTRNQFFGWACALSTLALVGCGKKGDDVVAVVNGETISRKEYYDHLERKQTIQVKTTEGVEDFPVSGSLGLQAMSDLVNRRLLLQIAKEEGVMPNKAEVDQELAFQTKRRPDFVSYLTDRGMTIEMIRNDLTFDLARERLLTKGVKITPEDVDLYVKENPKLFMEPEQASLLFVVVSDENKKKQVDADLRSGQNFQIIATKYSEAPMARENAGVFPVSNMDQMPKRLRAIVQATPELKVTDWQKDGKNWVKFYVQRKQPAKPIAMDEIKKEVVRRQLALKQSQRAAELGDLLNEKLAAAKVDLSLHYLKGPWDKAVKGAKAKTAKNETGSNSGSG